MPGTTGVTSIIVDGTLTTTALTTTTSTKTVITSTKTVVSVVTSTQGVGLEARNSWHKRVWFTNPWDSRRMCADAEWEKRGQQNTEIRLQEVRYEDSGNDCVDELSIDAPGPEVHTSHTTRTRTGYTNVATVISTVTETVVNPSLSSSSTQTATTIFPPQGIAVGEEDDVVPHSDL